MLKSNTPYMLRKDGTLLECGSVHPYIIASWGYDADYNYKRLMGKTHILDWFLENSQNEKTKDMLYMEECERPIAQQIFGSDKQSFIIAAKYIYENMHPDIIDINMGCPVPKVAVSAQGIYLVRIGEKSYKVKL